MTTSTHSAIIDIYAQAILAEAIQAEDVQAAIAESLRFAELSSAIIASHELRIHLNDKGTSLASRLSLIDRLFKDLPEAYLAVLRLLVERYELKLLQTINERFTSLIEDHFSLVIIDVTTVVALDDELRESIKEKYSTQLASPVALREHVDQSIMGGIVLQMRDRRIDASLNAQLERARAVLASDTIGGVS